ncbi:unnamed protein product, partial [Tetraodon nigroviridis]
RVLECQGLPIINGQCDPYAAVSLLGPSRSAPRSISHLFTVQAQKLMTRMLLLFLPVPPLVRPSQVGCKEDQGETENQQSSVRRGFLF